VSNPQEIVGNAMAGGSLWGRNATGFDAGGTYQFASSYSPAHQVRSKLGVKHAHPMCQLTRNQAWPPSSSIPFYATDDCHARFFAYCHNPGTGMKLFTSVLYWSDYVDNYVGSSDYATTDAAQGSDVLGGILHNLCPETDSGDATHIPAQSWNMRRGIWSFEWQVTVHPNLTPSTADPNNYAWSMDVVASRWFSLGIDHAIRGYKTANVDRLHPSPIDGYCRSSGTFTAMFRITNQWLAQFRLAVQPNLLGGFVEGDAVAWWSVYAHRTTYLLG
jgi:hypothetical protein